jgi:hypothetical protein
MPSDRLAEFEQCPFFIERNLEEDVALQRDSNKNRIKP